MLTRPLHHLRRHVSRNLVAYLALFIALGGTGYAATSLPAHGVGAAQLRDHSIGPAKLDPSQTSGTVRAWAIVGPQGHLIAGGGKPRSFETAINGTYTIRWGVKLPVKCATEATIDIAYSSPDEQIPGFGGLTAGYAIASSGRARRVSSTGVYTFDPSGQLTPLAFDVAVIC
jgi:hypothetical protein